MKASENNILKFIGGPDKNFVIPVYQRPYSWKKDNCVQLMKDLMEVYNRGYESHFFGSIVFVAQNDGACDEYTIIDGQQRITTVSLLLLAIRNYLLTNKDISVPTINPEKIKNAYLTDEYADNEKKLKLKLVQGDDAAYDALLNGNTPKEETTITTNYNYFYDEIASLSPEQIKGLYDAITKLVIVGISLQPSNGDDPQLIFESLNSTGLDLESSDKIRNFVLMGLKSSIQEKFYKQYWEPLEKIIGRTDMNKFIRYYLAVKTRKLFNESKLYFEFKFYHDNKKISIESILQDMLEYAEYYACITNPDSKKSYTEVLKRINRLDVNTCIPLIMDLFRAFHDGDISEDEMNKAFSIIENYIVRREICDLPTNALNKVFVQLGAEIDKDMDSLGVSYFDAFQHEILTRSGKSRFPNNHEFEDRFMMYDLYNAKGTIRKYILENLENHGTKERIDVEKLVSDGTLTIEHIMPQSLPDDWKSAIGDNWELVHSKYKDTVGNLTLTAYNSDYSNSPFQVKKTMPEKGFLFSKLSLNDYVKTCETWGESEIIERAKRLFTKAREIWWMPQMPSYTSESKDEWVEWDEDFDATYKKVVQVTVVDKVIKTVDVTDAYRKIHEILYNLEPSVYHTSKLGWFSRTPDILRKPYQIGDDAFIETNNSSQEKINTIKTMAELLEFESHDIRFLITEKKDKPDFNINDESTFDNIPVGKLAFEMFKKLIENDSISKDEVAKLKTKEFTKQLFSATDYPIIADSRDANKGNSKHMRYRKQSLSFDGKEIYITTQWFETNRADLIIWYKQHMRNN